MISGIAILIFVVPYQTHQLQETNQQIQQIKSQLNDASVNLIDTCMNDTSVGDLTGCKSTISDLKNKCQDSQYSSMSVCSDPRIDSFSTTYDSKLAYAESVISNAGSKMVDLCVNLISIGGGTQDC